MPQNRKFLAQREKEERQKRIIIIATITILVIVFGLIVYGVVDRYVLKPRTTVLQLESETIYADEFEQRIRYERFRTINDTYQLIEFVQSLGGTPDIFAYFEQQIMLSVNKLQQPFLIGQEMLQAQSDDLIILVEAEKMGIELDESQVEDEIRRLFGYFPDGTPTLVPTGEPIPTSTLSSQQLTLVPPTATSEVEMEEEQTTLPTNTPQIEEPPPGEPDPTATPLLKPTEFTLEVYQENYNNYVDMLSNEGIKEKTFRDIIKLFLIRVEILDEITKDLPKSQEQVWVRHILVEDEDTANEVAELLTDGSDFSELAATYSLDDFNKDSGGDLGWFARGAMVQPFEEAAFSLEVGEISEPIATDFGWHIIQGLGKEQKPIDEAAFEEARNTAFNDWLTAKRIEYQPEINDKWESFIPSEPALPQAVIDFIELQILQQSQLPTEIPQE